MYSYSHHIIRFKSYNTFTSEQLGIVRPIAIYAHLLTPVSFSFLHSAKAERSFILFTINRPLTFEGLHRRNLVRSPLCSTCNVTDSTEHYFLFCSNFDLQRSLLQQYFDALRIPFNVNTILSFGACFTGKAIKSLAKAVSQYLETASVPHL